MSDVRTETEVPARLIEAYKHAMRHVVSPVAVITYATEAGRGGMTSTAICSATTTPPALVVCLNRNAETRDAVAAAGAFAVNFLTDEQSEIARQFSTSAARQDQFSVGYWSAGALGVPVLEGTNASFECRVESIMEQGAHTIFIGAVERVETSDGSGLLYRDGFFRRVAPE